MRSAWLLGLRLWTASAALLAGNAALADAPSAPPAPTQSGPSAVTPPPLPPVKTTPAAAPVVPVAHRPRRRAPAPPPLPAPELKLSLVAPSPDGRWTARIENTGTVPLRVLADARALAFDVSPSNDPGAAPEPTTPRRHVKRLPHCALPVEMRAGSDEDRRIVIPPKRAFVTSFEPLLFCFGARNAAALVPGARVVPHLVGSRSAPAVEPVDAGNIADAQDWAGIEATIGAPPPAPAAAEDAADPPPLSVSTPAFVDVERGWEIPLPVSTTNLSGAPMALLLRPASFSFEVTGPTGIDDAAPPGTAPAVTRCALGGPALTAIAEVLTHLAPRRSSEVTVLLDALCPDGTFRRPGLYTVRARIDPRRVSGSRALRVEAEAVASRVTHLRIRKWTGEPPPLPRPHLVDPAE